ncbi:MAG: hypothetical protein ABSD98_00535 [Candidatus Korobacteraceae bacterium]|jgi:hypothetical protein
MSKGTIVLAPFLALALTLFAGCGSNTTLAAPPPAPLSSSNLNLIFVASEDLAYQAPGDINPSTANLTNQGLQRSLLMATFLQQKVLGMENVTEIYALEPMTHLQTANNYPDMVGLETIQQFAMLNQVTLSSDQYGGTPLAGHSYPINASYADVPLPIGVVPPQEYCSNCQGLDFRDQEGDNEALLTTIVKKDPPGFYVFSAPWETVSALMANINNLESYNLTLPASYISPNYIYAIAITPSGVASLITYNSNLNPPSTYPVLPPPPLISTTCTAQTHFSITVTGGQKGAVIPAGINTNETLYIIRHADAHPTAYWDDNNYVGAGQWRALDLPNALLGKVNVRQVYSNDPAQFGPGSVSASGDSTWSSVAPPLTAVPYAIANHLPYNLVTSFDLSDPKVAEKTSTFFFSGGQFSNQTVLLAWSFQFIQPTIAALLTSYNAAQQAPPSDVWPSTDYDTIWTVKLDAVGNLTVSNGTCEGIKSLPPSATPPQF